MTHLNDTMSTSLLTTHKKNAHLAKEERVVIETLKSQGLSNRAIRPQLGVNHQRINNELNRGTVRHLRRHKSNGKIYEHSYYIYSYEAGQATYLEHHRHSGRRRLYYSSKQFLRLADQLMLFFFKQKTAYEISECDWSSDVCSSDLDPFTINLLGDAFSGDARDF